MNIDEIYMRRCFQIAKGGIGHTAPNPKVGAVIVCDNKIIGEGYHRQCGEGHAEVNAIASVKDKTLLKKSTIYVSLEPCSHYGKTPPCADLIIQNEIPRVVIGCLDPFPEVSGRGVRKLKNAGIEVLIKVLEKEALALNPEFMTAHFKNRPYVYLKWAQSADGLIDTRRTSEVTAPVILSSSATMRRVHKLRAEVEAILVGTNTALLDNPSLTVRHWIGKQPVRIVLDRTLRLPKRLHVFDGTVPTLVFTELQVENIPGVEYIPIDFSVDLPGQVLRELNHRNLNSLMVEGGTCLLQSFFKSGLWDEAWVETAPVILKEGVVAPQAEGVLFSVEKREAHLLCKYRNNSLNTL